MDATTTTHFLEDKLRQQTRKVAAYDLDGNRVWVKTAGPETPYLLFRLLAVIVRWLGLSPLRPLNNHGSTEAIAIESHRLQKLAALELPVPQLLASTESGILIADLCQPSARAMNLHQTMTIRQDPAERLALLRQAVSAINNVHRKGTYLSQAFARNMVFTGNGDIGFIDFEEDPGQDLSLAECQARDLLCFIFSISLLFADSATRAMAIPVFADVLMHQRMETRHVTLKTMGRLAWMRHLPAGELLGKDAARARATGALLHGIMAQLAMPHQGSHQQHI